MNNSIGFFMAELISCPLCLNEDYSFWAKENGWNAVRCNKCGVVYLNPRPEIQQIVEASKIGLHLTTDGYISTTGYLSLKKVKIFKKRILEIFSHEELEKPNLRWLDIGCGYGELLMSIRQLTDESAFLCGVEPNEIKRHQAIKRGLIIWEEWINTKENKFDVISLINVFSHIPDPRSFFKKISKMLKANGIIIILTGNGPDIEPNQIPKPFGFPDHLIFFEQHHFKILLEELGFKIIKSWQYCKFFPVSEIERIVKNSIKYLLRKPCQSKTQLPYHDYLIKAQYVNL
jgi:2-polyprenyl-3-methyl-5-hydroxy-6-metoxy-1,4-benzoquinol methylase